MFIFIHKCYLLGVKESYADMHEQHDAPIMSTKCQLMLREIIWYLLLAGV